MREANPGLSAAALAVVVGLVVVVGLSAVYLVWLLMRAWHRHDQRHRGVRSGTPEGVDPWQASGDRLVGRLADPDSEDPADDEHDTRPDI